MGGISDLFTPLSFVYLLGAGATFYQLVQHWREFWSDNPTPLSRRLAGGVAFFLLVPIGVLLHEFGHMVAAWLTGSSVLGLHYFVYWGYVEIIPSSASPLLEWFIALAGNFVSYLIGIVAIAAAFRAHMKPIIRMVLVQLGILQLVQTLIFYPLISLDPGFHGDWDSIYSFQAPVASGITLAVHLLSLIALFYLLRTDRVTAQTQ
ncbi:MAG: M50 family metallopeptidase [Chloroflexota bacterium]